MQGIPASLADHDSGGRDRRVAMILTMLARASRRDHG
jgi:hypothetical protein